MADPSTPFKSRLRLFGIGAASGLVLVGGCVLLALTVNFGFLFVAPVISGIAVFEFGRAVFGMISAPMSKAYELVQVEVMTTDETLSLRKRLWVWGGFALLTSPVTIFGIWMN